MQATKELDFFGGQFFDAAVQPNQASRLHRGLVRSVGHEGSSRSSRHCSTWPTTRSLEPTTCSNVTGHELIARTLFDIANKPDANVRGSMTRANKARQHDPEPPRRPPACRHHTRHAKQGRGRLRSNLTGEEIDASERTSVVPLTGSASEVPDEPPQEHRHAAARGCGTSASARCSRSGTTSTDMLDVTAATLILQAIMAKDLESIQQLFTRLEGRGHLRPASSGASRARLRI